MDWKSPFSRFPAIKGVEWFNVGVLVFTPLAALYGILCVPKQRPTIIFGLIYFLASMIG
jgi:stearoyl-CoA desaturase (Delta-9 desaturase)